ncbi:uncharacterized protein LOC111342719 [Stylophora pistillata]|nr:uncharacterized protein LOC111342719 [Stylophora pistillata]
MNPTYTLLDLPVTECKGLDEDRVLYTFKKADHAKALLKNLAMMQANEGLLTDVALRSTSKDYEEPFHSTLLAACSPILKQNLTGKHFDCTGGKLYLKGLSTEVLVAFRGFLYKAEFPPRQDLVDALRRLAVTYGMDSLKKLCERNSNEEMLALWNSHYESLLSQLRDMCEKSELTSCLLQDCKGLAQSVHAPVVAAASPVLGKIVSKFQNDLCSSEETRYLLKEIAPNVLEDLVEYIYTGDVTLNGENVAGLLKAGSGYEIPALARACCDWLSLRMESFNAVNILWLAREENCKETKVLQEEAKSFIVANFTSVSEEDEFVEFENEDLKEIIQRDDLGVNYEEEVFNAVAKWVAADEDERTSYLPELLRCIRLQNTSPEFLQNLKQHPLIMKSASCVEYVQSALESQALFHLQEYTTPKTFHESELALYPDQYGFEDAISKDLMPKFLSSELELPGSDVPVKQTPRRVQRKDGTPDMRFKENRRLLGLQNKDRSPDMRFKVNKQGLNFSVKKDGTADMRFKVNRQFLGKDEEWRPLTKAGTPDRRFKVTRGNDAIVQSSLKKGRTPSTGPVKRDGTPDMRYAVNKQSYSLSPSGSYGGSPLQLPSNEASTGPLKRDGTADMRYAVNRQYTSPSPSRSYGSSSLQLSSYSRPSGPVKRDGTPDMRYAINKSLSDISFASSGYSSGGSIYSSRSSLSGSVSGLSSCGPLKSDGTPDMRYAANKSSYGSSRSTGSSFGGSSYSSRPSSSGGASLSSSCGPLKSNGTPDMRFKANRR